jgi:hypothetical protein
LLTTLTPTNKQQPTNNQTTPTTPTKHTTPPSEKNLHIHIHMHTVVQSKVISHGFYSKQRFSAGNDWNSIAKPSLN